MQEAYNKAQQKQKLGTGIGFLGNINTNKAVKEKDWKPNPKDVRADGTQKCGTGCETERNEETGRNTKGRNKCPDPDFLFWNAVPYNMAASAGGDRI